MPDTLLEAADERSRLLWRSSPPNGRGRYTLEQRMENENWMTHTVQTNWWYFVISAEISDCQLNMAQLQLFCFNEGAGNVSYCKCGFISYQHPNNLHICVSKVSFLSHRAIYTMTYWTFPLIKHIDLRTDTLISGFQFQTLNWLPSSLLLPLLPSPLSNLSFLVWSYTV